MLQKAKAQEYEKNCGALWARYRDCVHVGAADTNARTLRTANVRRSVQSSRRD